MAVGVRLAVMMFLEFFVWGSWYVTGPRFLTTIGFDGNDFGWMYSVGPIAGILSPFFVGMVADRFFSTERVLGCVHLLGSAAMFGATVLMRADSPDPRLINLMFFLHMLCYFPTLALTNSLAMHNVADSAKQFPLVRVFGTIGWIVAGFTVDGFMLEKFGFGGWKWGNSIEMFYLAAGSGALLGIYSFFLPHTPPPQAGNRVSVRQLLGLDALVLLRRRSFLAFIICSFLICIPLAFYYQLAERALGAAAVQDTPTKMTFGQISEILFMVLMPWFFVRLGVKRMLLVGMLAWVARYGLFAIGTPSEITSMMLVGVVLHGICYDFFFVTGQIYTDNVAPKSIRAQAQGMLVLFTLGLGMLIGAQVAGVIEQSNTPQATNVLNEEVQQLGRDIDALESSGATAAEIEEVTELRNAKQLQGLRLINWRTIWTIPAVGAACVMMLFALVFRDDNTTSRHT